jgi:hypothetical protein
MSTDCRKFIYIILVTYINLISCNSIENNNIETFNLEENKCNSLTSILNSAIVENIEYIYFNDIEYPIRGRFKSLKSTDGYYFLENISQNPLLFFNNNGDFVKTIGLVGNGPGEYYNPQDFLIDENSGTIEVLFAENGKINKYDYDGDFISTHKIDKIVHNFTKYDNRYFFSGGNNYGINETKIYEYDESISFEINSHLQIDKKTIPVSEYNLYTNGEFLIYKESYDEFIYKYENKQFTPAFKLEFNKYSIPKKFYNMNPIDGFELINEKGYAIVDKVIHSNNYIVFSIVKQKDNSAQNQIIFKKINDNKEYNFCDPYDTSNMTSPFLPEIINVDQNTLMFFTFWDIFHTYYSENNAKELIQKYKEIINHEHKGLIGIKVQLK